MIGVTADGENFPTYIIYKGRNTDGDTIAHQLCQVEAAEEDIEEVSGFPTSNFYNVQDFAWITSDLILDWIEKVYRPWCSTKQGPTILILDEFSSHMTTAMKQAVVDCGGFLEFIPASYTWKLQVMDVGINKPFKDYVRDCYDRWFGTVEYNYKTKPRREDVAQWIEAAFDCVTKATIINIWRKLEYQRRQHLKFVRK
jgi:DDE superfamily endonuclease